METGGSMIPTLSWLRTEVNAEQNKSGTTTLKNPRQRAERDASGAWVAGLGLTY